MVEGPRLAIVRIRILSVDLSKYARSFINKIHLFSEFVLLECRLYCLGILNQNILPYCLHFKSPLLFLGSTC